ncbi:hypothetical protein CKA32_001362 [Geitlerinema sp. FC II]|nr:hypothetical protein CKA32_001362 [Geitlerinema sp. FC II]
MLVKESPSGAIDFVSNLKKNTRTNGQIVMFDRAIPIDCNVLVNART